MVSSQEKAVAIISNVVPSVCLILLNKALVRIWNFPIALTVMHMVFLAVSLHVAATVDVFQPKRLPLTQTLLIALSGVGSIAFMNLSLTWNSVGVYQLAKLACIPCTVVIQTFFFKMTFSLAINLSLVVVMIGIAGTTVTDLEFNLVGVFWAILAVLSTTQYQIWIGSKQKEYSVSQFQMLYNVAPVMAVITLFAVPFFEGWGQNPVWQSDFLSDPWKLFLAFLSCVAAVAVNFSTYVLIRKTTVVTYLVVGHVKTILILTLGFVVFGNEVNALNIAYMSVSMAGVIMYSYLNFERGNTNTSSVNNNNNHDDKSKRP